MQPSDPGFVHAELAAFRLLISYLLFAQAKQGPDPKAFLRQVSQEMSGTIDMMEAADRARQRTAINAHMRATIMSLIAQLERSI